MFVRDALTLFCCYLLMFVREERQVDIMSIRASRHSTLHLTSITTPIEPRSASIIHHPPTVDAGVTLASPQCSRSSPELCRTLLQSRAVFGRRDQTSTSENKKSKLHYKISFYVRQKIHCLSWRFFLREQARKLQDAQAEKLTSLQVEKLTC